MSFMKPEIEHGHWWIVDTIDGSIHLPAEHFTRDDLEADYPDAEIEMVEGYGARLSAPGYLDATDWTVFDTEQEAIAHLEEEYGEAA